MSEQQLQHWFQKTCMEPACNNPGAENRSQVDLCQRQCLEYAQRAGNPIAQCRQTQMCNCMSSGGCTDTSIGDCGAMERCGMLSDA